MFNINKLEPKIRPWQYKHKCNADTNFRILYESNILFHTKYKHSVPKKIVFTYKCGKCNSSVVWTKYNLYVCTNCLCHASKIQAYLGIWILGHLIYRTKKVTI